IRTITSPTITLGTPDVCPNGTDTATVPPNYANYYWYVSNGSITGGQGTNSITFQAGYGNTPVEIFFNGMDAGGCYTPPTSTTATIRNITAPTISLGTL